MKGLLAERSERRNSHRPSSSGEPLSAIPSSSHFSAPIALTVDDLPPVAKQLLDQFQFR
jgi:hypothetical protein